jgi:hypothetical protein
VIHRSRQVLSAPQLCLSTLGWDDADDAFHNLDCPRAAGLVHGAQGARDIGDTEVCLAGHRSTQTTAALTTPATSIQVIAT